MTAGVELSALQPAERRALLRELLEQRSAAPLSVGQQWQWILQALAPSSAAYHFPMAFRIVSAYDTEALRASLQDIVDRHGAFRTRFVDRDGAPSQVVQESISVAFDVVDASALTEDELRARVADEADRPIDLANGPVFRAVLFSRSADEAVLLLLWHHLVLDGWSFGMVMEELDVILAARSAGREPVLPPVAPPYSEFVRWQSELLASAEGERQGEYWRRTLAGAERLELATDFKRPAQRSYRGGSLLFTIGETLTGDVARLASREGTTSFVVLLAAFQALLHRVSGQSSIPVSFPTSGRSESRFARTAGFFVNQLAVVAEIGATTTFRDLIAQMQSRVVGALENGDHHLSLLPRTGGAAGTARPVFGDVMFVLQKAHGFRLDLARGTHRDAAVLDGDGEMPRGTLGGLEVEGFPLEMRTARFDLELQMMEHGGALFGGIQYDRDLFEEGSIRALAQRFQRLLAEVTAEPMRTIAGVEILAPEERHRLLVELNDTRREWPSDGIVELFERQTRSTPDAVAASCGSTSLTFGELDVQSNRIAHWLRRSGAEPQQIVGLAIPRSLEMVVALLGIVKAGCVYLPLDPSNPAERLKLMAEDSAASFIVASRETCKRLPRSQARRLCLHCDAAAIARAPSTAPERVDAPLLYVIYTSGSTGVPKGVLGTHSGALNRFHWMWDRYPFEPDEVCAQVTTLGFVDSVWEILGPLLRGIPIAIVRDDEVRDAESLTSALEKSGATRITLVPSLLRALLEPADIGRRLQKLRYWSCSGEAMEPGLARQFHARMANGTLLNLYGCSEAAADSCCFAVPREWNAGRVPIGRPIANTTIYILDRNGAPVPEGSVGEIHVGGAGVSAGYLRRPELTDERFVALPIAPGERLYRTGDLGRYIADGNIEYFGRADQQLKIRGNRVEVAEVEAALRAHPDVESAAVQGVGESSGDRTLVAYVVLRSPDPSNSALRTHLARTLPSYMLPSQFVRLDAMPLTSSGKIDRRALPSPRSSGPSRGYIGPRTETERTLAELWAQVLDLPRIGVEDDFFEWGGHSILALQLASRASRLFGRPVTAASVIEFPTIASMAEEIDGVTEPGRRHRLVTVAADGTLPPLFWIPGGAGTLRMNRLRALADRLGPGQPFYALGTKRATNFEDVEPVPDRARAYVSEMRAQQRSGPYYIAGFCLGGVIAFEIARQLRDEGERVAFLGLINTWMPAKSIPGRQWIALYAQRAIHHMRAAARRDGATDRRHVLERARAVFRAVRRNKLTSQVHAADGDVTVEALPGDDAILGRTIHLASAYAPERYDGKVHVFVAEEPDLAGVTPSVDPRRAWRRVARATKMIRVRGGHEEMLDDPYVELFASELGQALRGAREAAGSSS